MAITPGTDYEDFPIPTADAATNAADIRAALGVAQKSTFLILSSGFDSDQNTTTYKTVTGLTSGALAPGNYFVEALLVHNGNASYASSGVKDQIAVISGTVTPTPVGNS
jgi:hypothetical protein